ncbi:hypothetical protein ACFY3N_16720 [Streptomyces sp. NPDC000348]|uniref:hypothetical protein n=1 Tax=Streptomyces sp. NPDC000348 TaxID=3364538 RepID=UPI0036A6E7A7
MSSGIVLLSDRKGAAIPLQECAEGLVGVRQGEPAALSDGFAACERFDAEGLAVLVLRGPGGSFGAEEKQWPEPQAVFGAAAVVTWEPPGGRIEQGGAAPAAAVPELAEESGSNP